MASLLDRDHRRLSVAIYSTMALVAFEGTAVAAALPDLTAELGDVDLLPWVLTGYLFMTGVTTIIAGSFIDALGPRRVFTTAIVIFAGAGFAAGLAQSIPVLVVIRLIQGGASGFVFAAGIGAVNIAYPTTLVGRAFAANSTIWGVIGAAGPGIAALMLSALSWRWIFFVNLPLGLVALVLGRPAMPGPADAGEPLAVDALGGLLAAAFTLLSILAVDALGLRSLALGAAAALVLTGYVFHARRTERPILRLEHIRFQPYASLAAVPGFMLAAAFSMNIYITLYVSAGRGHSAGAAAWSVIFFTVGWTIGSNVGSRLDHRVERESSIMLAGLVISTVGAAMFAIGTSATLVLAVPFAGLLLVGVGVGSTTNAGLTVLRSATPLQQIGRASAAHQFARGQGFTLGAAGGGAILLLVVDRELGSAEPIQRLLAGENDAVGDATAAAVRSGFGVIGLVGVVLMAMAFVPMLALRRTEDRAAVK